jgi:hypothetical protein
MWRGGGRPNIAVSASFVWRCLSGSPVAPFPHPAHRTGQAVLPHPACMGLSLSREHHAIFVFLIVPFFVRVRRETGKKSVVRVHHGEGVATHIDPESCADAREGIGEALTGERIGQAIEP